MVILHGLFGSAANWRTFATRLAATHHVYCLDLRNHGRSPHAAEHDYDAMAADVERFVLRKGLKAITLVGHSMGGKVAMQVALTRPNPIAALVVLDMGPGGYPVDRSIVDALSALDLRVHRSRRAIDVALAGELEDPRLRAFLLMGLEREAHGMRWKFNLPVIAAHYDALAAPVAQGRYAGPTLFLRGARSNYLAAHDAEISARFPAAAVGTIPDAGHWLHVEAPDATLAAVRQFAREVSHVSSKGLRGISTTARRD